MYTFEVRMYPVCVNVGNICDKPQAYYIYYIDT